MDALTFQPVCWAGKDLSREDDPDKIEYVIDIFGKTAEGDSVCVHVPFCPYFFVEVSGYTNPHAFAQEFRVDFEQQNPEDELLSASVVSRKPFYGFTNDKMTPFVRLVFGSLRASRTAQRMLSRRRGTRLYESNVDPVLRLMHIQDLESAGWVSVKTPSVLNGPRTTCCDVEFRARSYQDLTRVHRDSIAPLVVASFDIECISQDGGFPNPHDPGSKVIMIATCFQRYGETEPYKRHVVCLGSTAPVPGTVTEVVDHEHDIFLKWASVIRQEKTDVLTGYNIWGFDMNFVYQRAPRSFRTRVGRYLSVESAFVETNLKSSAYGNNEWKTFETHGILQVDLLTVVRKEHKLESYKLDSVAEHFLGEHKIDLNIHDMFGMYDSGDPEQRQKIAEYCVRDTELPLKIIQKLAVIPNLVEMAKATHVPLEFLLPRGQQIKAFSQILKLARQEGYVCPTNPSTKKQETYEGATVLDAQTGVYWNTITCLDFASLYPSIMRAHNMCHSTVVLDPRYDHLPGVDYYEVDGVRFAQNRQGILPKLLQDLAVFRKEAKKNMAKAKAEGDAFRESLFNGKQLAYKVSMNSVYGFCGAANGYLPCVPIASSVTTVGRRMIETTKGLIEERYPNANVRYGDTDSVMVEFGVDDIPECFRLGKEAAQMVTETFPKPIELTFEKCYRPYILFSKKRYCGLIYTKPDKPDYVDCKGIQLVRRDNCKLVRRVSSEVLERIMYHRDLEGAVATVRKVAEDLLESRIPMEELILSKTLKGSAEDMFMEMHQICHKCHGKMARSGDRLECGGCGQSRALLYKNSAQPHVHVACRMESRNPGAGPKANERVPYVFLASQAALQAERAEDPQYARENKLKLDGLYYLEHQLKSPMVQLFEQLLPNAEQHLFGEVERKFKNQKNKQREITAFFSHPLKRQGVSGQA